MKWETVSVRLHTSVNSINFWRGHWCNLRSDLKTIICTLKSILQLRGSQSRDKGHICARLKCERVLFLKYAASHCFIICLQPLQFMFVTASVFQLENKTWVNYSLLCWQKLENSQGPLEACTKIELEINEFPLSYNNWHLSNTHMLRETFTRLEFIQAFPPKNKINCKA